MKRASILFLILSGAFQLHHLITLACGNCIPSFIFSAISILLAFLSKDKDFLINISFGNLILLALPNIYRIITTGSS